MANSPLDDRGPHPKNPGDRKYPNGDEITLEANAAFAAGDWADYDGSGGLDAPQTDADGTVTSGDVIVKHDAESGEGVAAHTGGVVLANKAGQADVVDDGHPEGVVVHF